MLIWFAVASVAVVTVVFQSPGIDHRFVVVGAVAPVAEAVLGGPRVLHSVVTAVVLLAAVVLATSRRRLLRRRLIGLPIGVMVHLVLDGSFTRTDVFWWPISGRRFASGQVPELDHLGVSIALELVGLAMGVWGWRRAGLDDPERRARLLTDGRVELVPGGRSPR